MKLSEFMDRITPEDEGGKSTRAEWMTLAHGVAVSTREDDWDTYKVESESGEWTDGFHLIRYLVENGCIPDVEITVSVPYDGYDGASR
jgi:hypothetical protein